MSSMSPIAALSAARALMAQEHAQSAAANANTVFVRSILASSRADHGFLAREVRRRSRRVALTGRSWQALRATNLRRRAAEWAAALIGPRELGDG
jgi:hypothetical protein